MADQRARLPLSFKVRGQVIGSGKTYAVLLDLLWYHDIPKFTGVVFRRTSVQLTAPGSIWNESQSIYRDFGGQANQTSLEWKFPSGALFKMSHLQHEHDIYSHQGAQYTAIYLEEATSFTRNQFFYMLSRNRSTCGIKPYMKMTCNPDADSWVRELVDWWIDPITGYAISERSGVIRWFIVLEDKMHWADTEKELIEKYPNSFPKSFTFISASIFDNQKLLDIDKGYLANLHALPKVERERLLNGNWNIKPSAGLYFQKNYFEIVDAIPANTKKVRYWDRASTKKTDSNDPDYTVGILLEKDLNNIIYVSDMIRIQDTPLVVQTTIRNTAIHDGVNTGIGIEQDPGQAGVADVDNLSRQLQGFRVTKNKVSQDKVTRALPVSAQAEAGNIKVLRGRWNDEFFKELENFPDAKHDDIVDSLSGAYNMINANAYTLKGFGR